MTVRMKTETKNKCKTSQETFFKVARAALGRENISRTELALSTGLSKMTVGKVVDALNDMGVLTESRQERSRGRHASLVKASGALRLLILNFCGQNCTAHITDFSGNIIYSVKNRVSESLTLRDNIENMVEQICKAADICGYCAVGVITDGEYCLDGELCGMRSEARAELVKKEILSRYPDKNVLYIGVGYKVESYYFSRGNVIGSTRAVSGTIPQEDLLREIDTLYCGISSFSRPDTVIIETDGALADLYSLSDFPSAWKCRPQIYVGMELTNSAMFDLLIDEYARRLAQSV